MDVQPISQEKVDTEKALMSQCGKPVLSISYRPAYDQVSGVEVLSWLLTLFLPRPPALPLPTRSVALVRSFVDQGVGRAL